MNLRGQHRQEAGYAMAALLVALAVMAVLMSAALPAWRHQATREREAELVFRGEQYARAIGLWERKMGPGSRPPTLDALVQQKFLRKKYTDPMTQDGEFQPIYVGAAPTPGAPGGRGQPGGQGQPGGRGQPAQMQIQPQRNSAGGIRLQVGGGGGILGVRSKSTERSIRIYQGATHYNQWRFDHAGAAAAPGGGQGAPTPGGVGAPVPGGRGRGGGRMGPTPFPPGQGGRGPGRGGSQVPPGGRGRGGQ